MYIGENDVHYDTVRQPFRAFPLDSRARVARARASMARLDDAFDVEFIDDAVDEAVRDASCARAAAERARAEVCEARAERRREASATRTRARGRREDALESRRRREAAKTFDPRAEARRAAEARARASERMTLASAAEDDFDGARTMEEHERAWTSFERRVASEASRPVTLADVPWPRSGAWLIRESLGDDEDVARAHRAFARRWHPDKFTQRFGRALAPDEREDIVSRVKEVYQSARQLVEALTLASNSSL